jgi:hypothetical protein
MRLLIGAEDQGVAADEADAPVGLYRGQHASQVGGLVQVVPVQQADEGRPGRRDGPVAGAGQSSVVGQQQAEARVHGKGCEGRGHVVGRPVVNDDRFPGLQMLRLQRREGRPQQVRDAVCGHDHRHEGRRSDGFQDRFGVLVPGQPTDRKVVPGEARRIGGPAAVGTGGRLHHPNPLARPEALILSSTAP